MRRAELDLQTIGLGEDCSCGKMSFPTKAAARLYLKRQGPRAKRMRPYNCPEVGTVHVGHIPEAVVRGELTASEHYANRT